MNNDQFRRLLFKDSIGQAGSSPSQTRTQDGAVPTSLGSRMRASIPMTPRAVAGTSSVDFARQLREANAPPAKKFKSSAAPRGSKLAAGYVDRAQLREDAEEDDVAKRIKALEEMVKLGQMEQDAFERVRDELVGGDVRNVHLVKGLDRRLLERARRGEDVFAAPPAEEKVDRQEDTMDFDDALDELEARQVVPTVRVKQVGEQTSETAKKKRTRDDILREMKEARQKSTAKTEPQQQALGSRFRKVAKPLQPGESRLEIDEAGREVLVVMDMDGNIKRKVKKLKQANTNKEALPKPDKAAAPLGADVVIPDRRPLPPSPDEDLDQDLFADVGTDYDPLARLDDSDPDAQDDDDTKDAEPTKTKPPDNMESSKPRNYFNEETTEESKDKDNPLQDPDFLAAIRKAAVVADRLHKSDDLEEGLEDDEDRLKKLARRREMLNTHDRDAEDMDLGFGSSRFDDQDDGEARSMKLSQWDDEADQDGTKKSATQNQRKRGPKKKKKGDKNSASDVLAVLERRAKS